MVDAGLEEDAYLAALREVEVAGSIAFEGGANAFGKFLLRLYYDVAVALRVALAVVDGFFFYVAHGNDNSYKFHNTINN